MPVCFALTLISTLSVCFPPTDTEIVAVPGPIADRFVPSALTTPLSDEVMTVSILSALYEFGLNFNSTIRSSSSAIHSAVSASLLLMVALTSDPDEHALKSNNEKAQTATTSNKSFFFMIVCSSYDLNLL